MSSVSVEGERLWHRVVQSATLAPSVHNTQPWHFVIVDDQTLEIYADGSRQLPVLDPFGRQMLISVGCALFNARVELALQGYEPEVQLFPDRGQANLVASLRIPAQKQPWLPIVDYATAVGLRHTNRRPFEDETVPPSVVHDLVQAAQQEHGILVEITRPEDLLAVSRLSRHADHAQNSNAAYRSELRNWTTDDSTRPDGVSSQLVPRVDGPSRDDVPIRDFDVRGNAWLPSHTRSTVKQCLMLLGTKDDDRESWLHAGEALERVLLAATLAGYSASPLTQVIEVPHTRERLQDELGLSWHPHLLLRLGRAAKTSPSRRRPLTDVLTNRSIVQPGQDLRPSSPSPARSSVEG